MWKGRAPVAPIDGLELGRACGSKDALAASTVELYFSKAMLGVETDGEEGKVVARVVSAVTELSTPELLQHLP